MLLDAGASFAALEAELAKLRLEGYRLSASPVRRGGIGATQFVVETTGHEHHHRRLGDILEMIDRSALAPTAAARAKAIFTRLGQAEAKVHRISVEEVHFHEVGAVDSIIDIVGAAIALDLLGVGEVVCSPIPPGSGTVQCAHGLLPVPAPATAELLAGAKVAASELPGEVTTPTGAAILTTLAAAYGPLPAMDLQAVGCGAGMRQEGDLPNVLRVFIGRRDDLGQADSVVELSANLDDCTGEVIGATIAALLEMGCLDAWAAPVYMKKNRPAVVLSAVPARRRGRGGGGDLPPDQHLRRSPPHVHAGQTPSRARDCRDALRAGASQGRPSRRPGPDGRAGIRRLPGRRRVASCCGAPGHGIRHCRVPKGRPTMTPENTIIAVVAVACGAIVGAGVFIVLLRRLQRTSPPQSPSPLTPEQLKGLDDLVRQLDAPMADIDAGCGKPVATGRRNNPGRREGRQLREADESGETADQPAIATPADERPPAPPGATIRPPRRRRRPPSGMNSSRSPAPGRFRLPAERLPLSRRPPTPPNFAARATAGGAAPAPRGAACARNRASSRWTAARWNSC